METFLHSPGLGVDAEGYIQMGTGSGCALDTLLAPMLTGRAGRVVSTWPGLHPEAVLLAIGDAARLAEALALLCGKGGEMNSNALAATLTCPNPACQASAKRHQPAYACQLT